MYCYAEDSLEHKLLMFKYVYTYKYTRGYSSLFKHGLWRSVNTCMQIHSDHIYAILCIVGSVICAFDWGHLIIMFLLFMQNLTALKFTGIIVLICNQIHAKCIFSRSLK